MSDSSTPTPQLEPQNTSIANVSSGLNFDADQVTIDSDVVGRDKSPLSGRSNLSTTVLSQGLEQSERLLQQ